MRDEMILVARAEFYARAHTTRAYVRYVQEQGIDPWAVRDFAGATAIVPVYDCGGGMFDFEPHLHCPDEPFNAFVCEVLDSDGETTIDLAAWPINRPELVLTMFGRAPALGLWEAENPGSYYLGKSLCMRRTPLEWLVAGCSGSAIITPRLAGRWLLDLPGPIAARDNAHARQLHLLKMSVLDRAKVMVAKTEERLAA